MKKYIKYFAIIIIVLILILISVPLLVPIEKYQDVLKDQVKKSTGRDLIIDGEMTLSFLPTPTIKLTDVKFPSLPQTKKQFLFVVKEVSASLDMSQLLFGKITISKIELEQPKIVLEILKEGTKTWEFPNDNVGSPKVSSESKESSEAPFAISYLSIKGGNLTYINNSNGSRIENVKLDMKVNDVMSLKPNVSLKVSVESLNLDNLFTADKPNIQSATKTTATKTKSKAIESKLHSRWSDDEFDLSILDKFNGNLELSVHQLIKGWLIFDNLKMNMKLIDGNLNVASLTAGLYEGKLEGSGNIANDKMLVAGFKASIKSAQLRNIAPKNTQIKVMEGVFDLSSNLKASGNSVYKLVKNLSGKVDFNASNGHVSGFNLQKVVDTITQVKKINNLQGILNVLDASFSGGETAFKKLSGNMMLDHGVITLNDSVLEADNAHATAMGIIDLPKYSMDIDTQITVNVKNIPAFKVKIYGPVESPLHKIDTQSLQQYLIQNIFTSVIDNIQKSGKSGDIFKNILGGAGSANSSQSSNGQNSNRNTSDKPLDTLLQKGLENILNQR